MLYNNTGYKHCYVKFKSTWAAFKKSGAQRKRDYRLIIETWLYSKRDNTKLLKLQMALHISFQPVTMLLLPGLWSRNSNFGLRL